MQVGPRVFLGWAKLKHLYIMREKIQKRLSRWESSNWVFRYGVQLDCLPGRMAELKVRE